MLSMSSIYVRFLRIHFHDHSVEQQLPFPSLTLGADWFSSHFIGNLPLTQSLECSELHYPGTLSGRILPSSGRCGKLACKGVVDPLQNDRGSAVGSSTSGFSLGQSHMGVGLFP